MARLPKLMRITPNEMTLSSYLERDLGAVKSPKQIQRSYNDFESP